MGAKNGGRKKLAVVIVQNEVILRAVEEALEGEGYEVSRDIGSCARADIGFVGSYFALLGILNHIRAVNPALPLVLIVNPDYQLDGDYRADNDFYDVIELNNHDEAEINRKVAGWFSEERLAHRRAS